MFTTHGHLGILLLRTVGPRQVGMSSAEVPGIQLTWQLAHGLGTLFGLGLKGNQREAFHLLGPRILISRTFADSELLSVPDLRRAVRGCSGEHNFGHGAWISHGA